jgi:hypothetical protein
VRTRRILVGGLPYFGRMLAGLLTGDGWQAQYMAPALRRPASLIDAASLLANADLVYLVGGQIERQSRPDWLARVWRRPIVMHWVGSDVTYALAAAARGQTSQRLIARPEHWTEVAWTGAELRPLGVTSSVVPLTSTRVTGEPHPLPESFTVLTYLPAARPDFYGRAEVMRLAQAFPDVRFLVAGNDGAGSSSPPNVEFLGWAGDMSSVYARSTVLLRLPEHDGLSFMVLEALAAGRHVIWNHPLEGVHESNTDADARVFLAWLLAEHREGRLGLNQVGLQSVRQSYLPEHVRERILGRFTELLDSRS